MKGLILSGGKGTRLRPITYTGAKQLIPIANKPVLFYGIEAIRDAGITDVGIIVGDTREEIMQAVGDGSRWGICVTYIHQPEPLGLAHAVKIASQFLGEEPFVMYLGDNLVKDGITPFVREFEQMRPNAQILLAHVPNPQDFGVAVLNGESVVRLIEKPKHPPTDLALVGVYMFDHHIFEAVNAIQPSARGELEITDAIQYLIDHGYQVRSHIISGWWKDTGNLDAILEANRILLEDIERAVRAEVDSRSRLHGRVSIAEGTRIINSVIRGPVIVGANCLIENAYIGPFTSIADGVQVVSSEVEHSVILEGCRILNIGSRMEDSLLGRNVTVCRDEGKPRAVRLMLGDNSQVNLL